MVTPMLSLCLHGGFAMTLSLLFAMICMVGGVGLLIVAIVAAVVFVKRKDF